MKRPALSYGTSSPIPFAPVWLVVLGNTRTAAASSGAARLRKRALSFRVASLTRLAPHPYLRADGFQLHRRREPTRTVADALGRWPRERQADAIVAAAVYTERASDDEDDALLHRLGEQRLARASRREAG